MTIKTTITLDLLRDAYAVDRDMAAACQRFIARSLGGTKRLRRALRRSFGRPVATAMYERQIKRSARNRRTVRLLAREHGWAL